MGRKYLSAECNHKARKIFLDDLTKIYKRRVKNTPLIPRFQSDK
jgi:hypothetical protein